MASRKSRPEPNGGRPHPRSRSSEVLAGSAKSFFRPPVACAAAKKLEFFFVTFFAPASKRFVSTINRATIFFPHFFLFSSERGSQSRTSFSLPLFDDPVRESLLDEAARRAEMRECWDNKTADDRSPAKTDCKSFSTSSPTPHPLPPRPPTGRRRSRRFFFTLRVLFFSIFEFFLLLVQQEKKKFHVFLVENH